MWQLLPLKKKKKSEQLERQKKFSSIFHIMLECLKTKQNTTNKIMRVPLNMIMWITVENGEADVACSLITVSKCEKY